MDPTLSKARFDRDVENLLKEKEKFAQVGIRLVKSEYPVLIVGLLWNAKSKEILLHVEANDYDYLPVRGWWVDQDDNPLKGGSGQIPTGAGFQVGPNTYSEQTSWFCFLGWREYHDHESHQTISWESIRENQQYRILGVIMQLKHDLNDGRVQQN